MWHRLKHFLSNLFNVYINYFVFLKLLSSRKVENFIFSQLRDRKDILTSYYLDLATLLTIERLNEGIQVKKGHIYCKYDALGSQYNPLTEALYALVFYQKQNYDLFFKLLKKLTEEATILKVKDKEVALWYYRFLFPSRAYSKRWISGMTQGVIASLYSRAFYLTNNDFYRSLCIKSISGMLIPIEYGGTLYKNKGCLWIEEYPEEKPLMHVLNGFIFALLGLYDTYLITNDEKYIKIFNVLLKCLKKCMKHYDLILWSKYDIANVAGPSYHFLHVILIYILYKLTYDEDLKRYSLKWLNGFKILLLAFFIPYFILSLVLPIKKRVCMRTT